MCVLNTNTKVLHVSPYTETVEIKQLYLIPQQVKPGLVCSTASKITLHMHKQDFLGWGGWGWFLLSGGLKTLCHKYCRAHTYLVMITYKMSTNFSPAGNPAVITRCLRLKISHRPSYSIVILYTYRLICYSTNQNSLDYGKLYL